VTYNRGVGVAYSFPDSPFTRITVVYRCPCGAVVSEVGRHAGEGPEGWEQTRADGYICAHCAELMRAGALPTSPASA
jgi:hypothetical protein